MSTMLRSVVFLCAVIVLAKSETTIVNQCTTNVGDLPINIYVEGCTTPPCSLPQLQDAVINIVFRAPRNMLSMRTLASAFLQIGAITLPGVPYDLGPQAETCNFLDNTFCPIIRDEVVQYTLRMYIESFFPVGTNAIVEFRVVDHNNLPAFCVRVGIRILPAVTDTARIDNGTVV